MKTYTQLFKDTYDALAKKQNEKYGNPLGEAPVDQVVPRVQSLVDQKLITDEQARKVLKKLGRTAYGEYGLTHGRVLADAESVIGFNLPWNGIYQTFCEIAR